MRQRFVHVQLRLGFWSRVRYLLKGTAIQILLRRDGDRWVVDGVGFDNGTPTDGAR